MKSSHSIETFLVRGMPGRMSLFIIIYYARKIFYSSILSPHGLPPTNISTTVHPRDHMSLLLTDPSSEITSGAIHYTLPTIWLLIEVKLEDPELVSFLNSLALPKSQSLIIPSLFVKIFEHFKSKCFIF